MSKLIDLGAITAYGIAKDHGFQGTEEEWLESLKGQGMAVQGRYDTLDDLTAAHPTGSAGDAYAVGTAEENEVYVWDIAKRSWVSVGSLRGKPGKDGEDGQPGKDGEDGQPGKDGASATDKQVEDAVNSWLDNHPEATTTVQDGSITQAKMAFPVIECKKSPNLIDPDELISARFTNANGSRQAFADGTSYYNSWRMTGYIDVSSHIGEQIWIHNMQGYCFYDDSKAVISNSGYANTAFYIEGDTAGITIPDGASYVALSMYHSSGREYIANFGVELLVYTAYGEITLPENSVSVENINGQLPLDKINTSNLLLPTIGVNLIDKSKMVKNYKMSTAGTPTAVAESLSNWYVTNIPVIGGDTYLLCGNDIIFFDAYGNVCGSETTGGYRKITAPASAVCCAVNSADYADVPAHIEHGAFLIHGDNLPDRVVNAKYYEAEALEDTAMYKSVLHRMADCWNPSTKTVIGLYGDSNTIGIEGNGNTTQNPECWANLLTAEIQRKFAGERYIYPFGDIGVWGCSSYNKMEASARNGVIKIPFYGTSISLVSGTVATVPKQFNVSFDDGEQTLYTIEEAGTYTWDGLDEGYHTITLISADNVNFLISRFIVNKTVEVINRGISGRGLGNIYGDIGVVEDTIEIICSGTNNRGNKNMLKTEAALSLWEYQNRATKHIYMSPIPARDAIETAGAAWGTVPYIESYIAGREAKKNCEYISLYHEMIDYCDRTGTDIATLYVDGLHLNDAGHKVIAKILCRKLGLGDLTE